MMKRKREAHERALWPRDVPEENEAPAPWRGALGAARRWLSVNCVRGHLCALDAHERAWQVFVSRSRGHLYFAVPGHEPTAEKSSLALRPRKDDRVARHGAPPPAVLVVRPPRQKARATPPAPPGPAVAQGAFAQVCIATDGLRTWAVKRALRARLSCSESLFRDEHFLRVVAGHPHVVCLLGSYLDEEHRPCLVLPAAQGDLAGHHPSTLDDFWVLARQLCQAVGHVHACGVVHLDIKPHNVLVFGDGRHHCLADFGSATRTGHALDDEKLYECTRPFRAPEIVFGAEVAAWPGQDLWSLGALLWDVCPEDGGHPLQGAQNDVEQAALVLALTGVCVPLLCSWRFSPAQAAACCFGAAGTIEPYVSPDGSAAARLRASLLCAAPEDRALAPLLLLARAQVPEEEAQHRQGR